MYIWEEKKLPLTKWEKMGDLCQTNKLFKKNYFNENQVLLINTFFLSTKNFYNRK